MMNPAEIELHLAGGHEVAVELGDLYLEAESADGNPCCSECAGRSRAQAEIDAIATIPGATRTKRCCCGSEVCGEQGCSETSCIPGLGCKVINKWPCPTR